MSQESLNFAITLSGTFWEKRPQFSIWIDEHVVVQSELPDQHPHTFKFSKTVSYGPVSIKIRLENKTTQDTVTDGNSIVKDMLLNIKDIKINDLSLGELLWSAEYILDQPHEYQGNTINTLSNCVNLGWNGTYILTFTSPFSLWLLEKL